jgi:hypothetical protein
MGRSTNKRRINRIFKLKLEEKIVKNKLKLKKNLNLIEIELQSSF